MTDCHVTSSSSNISLWTKSSAFSLSFSFAILYQYYCEYEYDYAGEHWGSPDAFSPVKDFGAIERVERNQVENCKPRIDLCADCEQLYWHCGCKCYEKQCKNHVYRSSDNAYLADVFLFQFLGQEAFL